MRAGLLSHSGIMALGGQCCCVAGTAANSRISPPTTPLDTSISYVHAGPRLTALLHAPQGLCPFAAPVRNKRAGEQPALRCAVTHAAQTDELLSAVRAELALLAPGITSQRPPESTLLVVSPAGDSTFLEEYRDFVSTILTRISACAPCASRCAMQFFTHRGPEHLIFPALAGARVVGCAAGNSGGWS